MQPQLTANKNVYLRRANVKFFNFASPAMKLVPGIGFGIWHLARISTGSAPVCLRRCQAAGDCFLNSHTQRAAPEGAEEEARLEARHGTPRQTVAELIRCHAPRCVKKAQQRTVVVLRILMVKFNDSPREHIRNSKSVLFKKIY